MRSAASIRIALFLLAAVVIVFNPAKAHAADTVEVTGSNGVRVYTQPNLLSQVTTTLPKGARFVAAAQNQGTFKKILFIDKKTGKKQFGFVSLADLRNNTHGSTAPLIAPGKPGVRAAGGRKYVKRGNFKSRHGTWSGGIKLGLNYETQSAKNYSSSDGSSANVSALSGSSFMFEGFIDMPMSPTFNISGYFQYKPTSGTGTGTPANSLTGTQPLNIVLQETFISVGAMARFYSNPRANFWYGGGLQLDHGSSGTLQFGTKPINTISGSDLPNFFMAYGVLGYDWALGGNFILVPDIRLGAIFNTSPPIFEIDGMLGVAYTF